MDSVDALVYVADMKNYEILFINEYGRSRHGNVAGRLCWQTLQKNQDGPCPFCTNTKLIDADGNSTGVYRWEFQNTHNGRWYDCRDRAIHWIDGRLARLEIAFDITARKQARAQFLQLQKAESLRCMAGAIAHNYNNALTIVMGNLELMLRKIESSPATQDHAVYLHNALKATHRAVEMGRSMMAYLGNTVVHRTPIQLGDVCLRVLAELQNTMPPGAVLNISSDIIDISIIGDAVQIEQILVSLIDNAREALPYEHGIISVTLYTAAPGEIPTTTRLPHDFKPTGTAYVCIQVTDNGHGIHKENMEKVFDPFFSTRFIGRGLGLPVVLGTVRAHNGCIVVQSTPGLGTVFRIYLPTLVS